MGKVVVKRFLDDKLGLDAAAVARWANGHNARVVSQSVSNGWIIVTFELIDEVPFDSFLSGSVTETSLGSFVTTREASVEEQIELAKSYKKLKSHPSKVTITSVEEPEETAPEKSKKKRWWK